MLNKVNSTTYSQNRQPAFAKGSLGAANDLLLGGYKFLQNYPIAEIAGMDVTTMAVPRTYENGKQNFVYGVETFVKETVAMIPNPFLPGIIAGVMIAHKGNKGLYTDSKTLNMLHEAWKTSGGEKFDPKNPDKEIVKKYVKTLLKNTEGIERATSEKLNDKDLKKITNSLTEEIANGYEKGNRKSQNQFLKRIEKIAGEFTEATGASEHITVKKFGAMTEDLGTNIRMLFRDKAEAGVQIFTKKGGHEVAEEIGKLANYSKTRTAAAIIPSIILGASMQGLIARATKAFTGKEDFPGYKSFGNKDCNTNAEENKKPSVGNRLIRMAGILGIALATMGGFTKHNVFKKAGRSSLIDSLEMKDKFAHLQVIKLVYGSIIAGRLWNSRKDTELKTTTYQDYSGFLNWLVLGPFVSKGIASGIKAVTGINLLNGETKGKNILEKTKSWLSDVHFKAPDEISAMANKLPQGKGKVKLAYNLARTAGVAWATFALGIGMPRFLNKYVIDKDDKKRCKETKPTNSPVQGNTLLSFMQNSRPSMLKRYNNMMA